jgi:hypothetical protein
MNDIGYHGFRPYALIFRLLTPNSHALHVIFKCPADVRKGVLGILDGALHRFQPKWYGPYPSNSDAGIFAAFFIRASP